MFHMPGGPEWIVVLVIALLIFGRNLPDVGRSLGKSIVEFKKGLKGMENEMHTIDREVDRQVNQESTQSKDQSKLTS